jgi:hypothetical protein
VVFLDDDLRTTARTPRLELGPKSYLSVVMARCKFHPTSLIYAMPYSANENGLRTIVPSPVGPPMASQVPEMEHCTQRS